MATHIEPSNRWQFSEDEIRAKLEELGYNNIPDKALKEFSKGIQVGTKNVKILSDNNILHIIVNL